MLPRIALIALLALASSGLVSCTSTLALLDGTGRYLLNGVAGRRSEPIKVHGTTALGTLCAASGLFPPVLLDADAAQQVRRRHAAACLIRCLLARARVWGPATGCSHS